MTTLDVFRAVAERRITAEEGARMLSERRGTVFRLGRLRVQLGGEGWWWGLLRLEGANNPHWARVAHFGPISFRWARASRQRRGR